jgi:hypothetical protein
MHDADAFACIELRSAYVAASRGRGHHWVICCRHPGKSWELWAGSETKEDVERIREGLFERRPQLRNIDWLLVGPGGV